MRAELQNKREGVIGRIGRAARNVARKLEGKSSLGRPVTAAELVAAARSGCPGCVGRGFYRVIKRANRRTGSTPDGSASYTMREPGFHSVPREICQCALRRFPRVNTGRVDVDGVGNLHWIAGKAPEDQVVTATARPPRAKDLRRAYRAGHVVLAVAT